MDDKLIEGEELCNAGKYEEAEKVFLSIVEEDPENNAAFNNLGVLAFKKGNTKDAINYFTRSLGINPLHKDTIVNYTDLLKSLNQAHIAIPYLEKLIEVDPEDDDLKNLLETLRPE